MLIRVSPKLFILLEVKRYTDSLRFGLKGQGPVKKSGREDV